MYLYKRCWLEWGGIQMNEFPTNMELYYQRNRQRYQHVYEYQLGDTIVYIIIKRMMDLFFSFLGLIIGIPIMFIFAIAIKLESEGPVFFKQERVGIDGKHFIMYKLRSMYIDAEENGAQWAEADDPRVTRVGRFIRKTRIDEIPQIFNIIKGDMSVVGPRPERPIFTYKFNEQIPGFVDRLQIKPGLTGWAQINGGYELTPKEKLDKDLYYIKNRSIMLDLKIIFKTMIIVLTGNGAF